MMMPSIFGENLFDDDWMNFPFDQDFWGKKNPLYGKHAKNMMKTDIREHEKGYEVDIDLPGFKKDEIGIELENGYLTVSAAKGLDKDEEDKKEKKNLHPPKCSDNNCESSLYKNCEVSSQGQQS